MASEARLEHDVKYVRGYSSISLAARIKEMCDDMHGDGWALLSVSCMDDEVAMLVFSRPRKEE